MACQKPEREGCNCAKTAVEIQAQIPFQHTFRLVEAKALLLEICVTYLYCPAKELQDGRASGHGMLATQCFLRYVAQTWMVHFGQLKHKLQLRDPDLWYFHNLCHPLFPAIQTWTREYWQPDVSKQPIGVPDDHIQEYYPGRFNLQCQVVRYYDGDHDYDHGSDGLTGEGGDEEEGNAEEDGDYQGRDASRMEAFFSAIRHRWPMIISRFESMLPGWWCWTFGDTEVGAGRLRVTRG